MPATEDLLVGRSLVITNALQHFGQDDTADAHGF
jgi:hypothetical protein